jgi:predicted nucleic acid-binding protein
MIGIDTTFIVQLEIQEMPEHARAHELLRRAVIDAGDAVALAPQVLTEFLHVVTDARRFERPLTMEQALAKARYWWDASEIRHVYPTGESTALFMEWIARHNLGRKRLLDTHLAATYWTAGVRRILTSNARDFAVFGVFEALSP